MLVTAALFAEIGEHDESLAIGRDVVVRERKPADRHADHPALEWPLEEHPRLPCPERSTGDVDVRHRDARIGAPEDLFTVPRPPRAPAAGLRHLPLSVTLGERPHVHLVATRLVGRIGDPSTIGREVRESVAELRREELFRLARLEIENPEVVLRVRLDEGDVAAVRAPGARPLGFVGLSEGLDLSRAVGALAKEAVRPVLVRREDQALAVRRPDLLALDALAEGEAGPHAALEIVHPDVPVVVAQHGEREPPTIRREPRIGIDTLVGQQRLRPALAVDPEDREGATLDFRGDVREQPGGREVELGSTLARADRQVLQHRDRRSFDLEPLEVERHREQGPAVGEDEVAAGNVAPVATPPVDHLALAALERHHFEGGVVEAAGFALRGEEDLVAAGESLRPTMRHFLSLLVELGERSQLPPTARTRDSPPLEVEAITMVSSGSQVAPRLRETSQILIGAPAVTCTLYNPDVVTNPTHFPSGEKKGW